MMGRKAPKREPCFLTKIWTIGRWTTIIIYNQHPLQTKGCAWLQLEAEGLVLQHKDSSWIIFLWVPKTWSIYYDLLLFSIISYYFYYASLIYEHFKSFPNKFLNHHSIHHWSSTEQPSRSSSSQRSPRGMHVLVAAIHAGNWDYMFCGLIAWLKRMYIQRRNMLL